MQLLARRIERQFQRNYRRHVFADELRVKIQQMRECFTRDTLPCPTAKVIAAWNDLPNDMIDALPISMKTGLVFLRAPPPTPTGLAFDTDDATSSDSSFNDSHDNGWVFVDTPTPDVVASWTLRGSIASDDSMSRCSHPDAYSDKQNIEENPFQSTDSNSPSSSSDQESSSSGSRTSSTPVGFYNMVDQWFLDYRTRGTAPFIESLIAFGVVSLGTAPLASRIARAIIRRVAKISYTEGKNLENTVRFAALVSFKKYWESVSQCHRLRAFGLGQQSGIYRTIPGWTCHLPHTVSILPASSVACSIQGSSPQGIFIFACPFYWKERSALIACAQCMHCWSKPTISCARIATSRS